MAETTFLDAFVAAALHEPLSDLSDNGGGSDAMKLIISKDGIKREICGSFALCCSSEDLELLIRLLQQARGSMLESPYGWVRIDPSHPSDASSGRPLPWTTQ